MNDKRKENCTIEGCENEAHGPLRVCWTCHSGLRYWRDRSPADKRKRHKQIVRLQNRMEYIMVGGPMPAKAKPKKGAKANGGAK